MCTVINRWSENFVFTNRKRLTLSIYENSFNVNFLEFDLFSHLPVIACRRTFVASGREAPVHLGPLYFEILVGIVCTIETSLSFQKASRFVSDISIQIFVAAILMSVYERRHNIVINRFSGKCKFIL